MLFIGCGSRPVTDWNEKNKYLIVCQFEDSSMSFLVGKKKKKRQAMSWHEGKAWGKIMYLVNK